MTILKMELNGTKGYCFRGECRSTTSAQLRCQHFVVSIEKAGAREKEIIRYLSIMEDTFLAIDIAGQKQLQK